MTVLNRALTRLFDAAWVRSTGCLRWPAWPCCRWSRRSPSSWRSSGPPTSGRSSPRSERCRRPSSRCGCSTTTSSRCFAHRARCCATRSRYLRLSLAPTLWLIVPMLALMLHMEFRFGYTGLTIGEAALVRLRLGDAIQGREMGARETAPETAQSRRWRRPMASSVETPACRCRPSVRSRGESGRAPRGSYELRVHVGGTVLTKTLVVSDARGASIAGAARRRLPQSAALSIRDATAGRFGPERQSRSPIPNAPSPSPAGTSAGRASTWPSRWCLRWSSSDRSA